MALVRVEYGDLDALERKVSTIAEEATTIAKFAVYDGAKVAADALRVATNSLQAVSDYDAINAKRRGERTYISYKQKLGLQNGLGIAKMRVDSDSVDTRVSFGGMNTVITPRWPTGQPNVMVAAEVNHGTSGRTIRQPFVTVSEELYRKDIIRAMIRTATEKITEILDS